KLSSGHLVYDVLGLAADCADRAQANWSDQLVFMRPGLNSRATDDWERIDWQRYVGGIRGVPGVRDRAGSRAGSRLRCGDQEHSRGWPLAWRLGVGRRCVL